MHKLFIGRERIMLDLTKNNFISFFNFTEHNVEDDSDMLMEPDEFRSTALIPSHSSFYQSSGKQKREKKIKTSCMPNSFLLFNLQLFFFL